MTALCLISEENGHLSCGVAGGLPTHCSRLATLALRKAGERDRLAQALRTLVRSRHSSPVRITYAVLTLHSPRLACVSERRRAASF